MIFYEDQPGSIIFCEDGLGLAEPLSTWKGVARKNPAGAIPRGFSCTVSAMIEPVAEQARPRIVRAGYFNSKVTVTWTL